MEKLDKDLQKRVWDRVYPKRDSLPPQRRQQLRQSLARAQANFTLWDQLRSHPVYGEAFDRMARETAEQMKMLRQILGR